MDERFTILLRNLHFDSEVLEWAKEALLHSHKDARPYRVEAGSRLQDEQKRLQGRIDAMYIDKLDGVVDRGFFERKSRHEATRSFGSLKLPMQGVTMASLMPSSRANDSWLSTNDSPA